MSSITRLILVTAGATVALEVTRQLSKWFDAKRENRFGVDIPFTPQRKEYVSTYQRVSYISHVEKTDPNLAAALRAMTDEQFHRHIESIVVDAPDATKPAQEETQQSA